MSPHKRWLIVVGLVIGVAGRGEAQSIAGTFEQLQVLVKPGATVTIHDTAGEEVTGRIGRLSSSSLELLASNGAREFRESDVMRIRQRRPDSLANGAAYGLAAGLGAGALLAALVCSEADCGPVPALAVALYGAIGTGIGVGADALIARRQVIFERRSGALGVGISPIVASHRGGAVLAIRF